MFKKIFVFLCYSFVVFLSFLLFVPAYSVAQSCNSIDYNKPTIAAGAYHTVGLKKDGTVLAAGYNGSVGLMSLHGQISRLTQYLAKDCVCQKMQLHFVGYPLG